MDSLGVATDGSLLVPGFPVLSKVAWTYADESAREIFRAIRDLATEAVQQGGTLRFGHP
jgi:hypothetical protein